MRRRTGLIALLSGVVVTLGASCRDPTEITLRLSTDLTACPPEPASKIAGTTTIAVGADFAALGNAPGATADTCTPGAPRTIGDLVLVPSGDRGAEIVVEVVAGLGRDACDAHVPSASLAGCIVARRKLRFVAHTPLLLPIELRQECAGVRCAPDETCIPGGGCVASLCTDPSCSNFGPPGGSAGDGGPAGDTGVVGRSDGGPVVDGGKPDGAGPHDGGDGGACGPFSAGIDCGPAGPCSAGADQCCNNACTPAGNTCAAKIQNISLKCDETADCPPGNVCCIHLPVVGTIFSRCEAQCDPVGVTSAQVCKQPCECAGVDCTGACGTFARTCGGLCPVPG